MGRQPAVTYRSDKAHRVFSPPTASYLNPQPDHPFESKNEKTVFFNTTFDNHWKQFLNLQPKFAYHEQKAFLIGNLLRHTACFIMHNITKFHYRQTSSIKRNRSYSWQHYGRRLSALFFRTSQLDSHWFSIWKTPNGRAWELNILPTKWQLLECHIFRFKQRKLHYGM